MKFMKISNRDEIPLILNRNDLCDIGAEVGVCKGEFSNLILQTWKGKKLYLIDAWRHIENLIDMNNPDHNGQLNNLAHAFMNTYKFDDRVCLIKELSVAAAELFKNESLDFVYLDAAHSYEFIKADILAWFPKVKKGGLFCGHDYIEDGIKWDSEFGVKKAVNEFVKEAGLELSVTEEFLPSWYIWKG